MHVGDYRVGARSIAPDLGNDGTDVMTNIGNGPCPSAREAVILQVHLIQGYISVSFLAKIADLA